MINTLILANGLLVIFLILCVGLYLEFSTRKLLFKMKMKLSQNAVALRVVYKKMEVMEAAFSSTERALLENQKMRTAQEFNDIEKQYEKAKTVLKTGSNEEIHSLERTDMTSEEIELLTGLMQSVDFNGKTNVTSGRDF